MGLKRLFTKIVDYIAETVALNEEYYTGKKRQTGATGESCESIQKRADETALSNNKQNAHDIQDKEKTDYAVDVTALCVTSDKDNRLDSACDYNAVARINARPNAVDVVAKECALETASQEANLRFPDWHITISFGKSSSSNYQKALYMAKNAPQYTEYEHNGMLIHQAVYSGERSEFLQFRVLYELVKNWKSAHTFINGEVAMRKAVTAVLSCYEWKCHSSDPYYCYNLQNPKNNPFPCRYVNISKWNNPFWTFYIEKGSECILDEKRLKEVIDRAAIERRFCPAFDYDNMMRIFNDTPRKISRSQFEILVDESGNGYYSR